ncbi:MAG TPA: hypothetical protein VGH23_22110 [Rhizomicrobium sp.]|jgi:hypothetical protein
MTTNEILIVTLSVLAVMMIVGVIIVVEDQSIDDDGSVAQFCEIMSCRGALHLFNEAKLERRRTSLTVRRPFWAQISLFMAMGALPGSCRTLNSSFNDNFGR